MKLYANVSSERASKGQGGEWLDIKIRDEKKDLLWNIEVRESLNFYSIRVIPSNISLKSQLSIIQKGKRQKGEREGICHCGYPCIYGTDYCERHQIP